MFVPNRPSPSWRTAAAAALVLAPLAGCTFTAPGESGAINDIVIMVCFGSCATDSATSSPYRAPSHTVTLPPKLASPEPDARIDFAPIMPDTSEPVVPTTGGEPVG